MRTLALQGFLISAVAIAATGGTPVDDQGQTKTTETILVPVLINDPAGTTLLGIVSGGTVSTATLPSGATVTVVGEQIRYSPNGVVAAGTADTFTYITDCGTATVTVAVTGGTQPGGNLDVAAPQDDSAVTRPNTAVRIDVLRNDPQDSLITSVGTPTAGGTAVIYDPELDLTIPFTGIEAGNKRITYTPPAGAGIGGDFTDTFTYTTQGGTATVTVLVSTSAATPVGPPVEDDAATSADQSVTIDVLNNDPRGSLLYGVCDPNVGRPDNGTAIIRGNKIVYTPDPDRSINPPYNVTFCYQTNGGSGTVSVDVGNISGGINQSRIELRNATRFSIVFRVVTGDTDVFFEDCDTSEPLGSFQVDPGDPDAMPPVVTVEPMGTDDLCVGLPSATTTRLPFTAESTAAITVNGVAITPKSGVTPCGGFVLFPLGPPKAIEVREVLTFNNANPPQLIDIGFQIICNP